MSTLGRAKARPWLDTPMFHFYQLRKLLELAWRADQAETIEEMGQLIEYCDQKGYELVSELLNRSMLHLSKGYSLDYFGDDPKPKPKAKESLIRRVARRKRKKKVA